MVTNVSSQTTYWNNEEMAAGLAGDLLRMGAGRTPLLDKIGGLGGNAKLARDWRFIMSNQYGMEAPAQKTITETAASAAPPTPLTYDKDQEYNVCQVFQYGVTVTYQAQSATSYLTGLPLSGPQQEPVDPLTFQLKANMEQMALDVDWHLINGTYATAANAGQPFQTRGLLEAISTNKQDCGADALTTADIDAAMIMLADTSKSPMQDLWLICTATVKQKVTQLYGNAPLTAPTTTLGGQTIETIITDFGPLKLMYEPQMPAYHALILDMPFLAPVFLPVPGKGAVFYEPLAKTGTAEKGMLYGQVGLTYTAQKYHALLDNFTT